MKERIVLEDIIAISIPEGKETLLLKESVIYIQQVLGGNFTVQTEDGRLLRIDAKDAKAINEEIPEGIKEYTIKDIEEKGLEHIIKDILKTIYDPEIPVNILDLGLVYEIEIKKDLKDEKQNIIRIEMTLTAPGCGMGEVLKTDVERRLKSLPTVKYVIVDLVFDPAWDSSMMSDSAKLTLGFM